MGKPLYEAGAWLSNCRISPRGDQIAFAEHPGFNDTFGSLVVTDTAGHHKTLEKDWFELLDLAWSPKGDEIWFTGSSQGGQRSLYAVKVQDGRTRPVLEAPGNVVLKDIFRDGKVLLVRENLRVLSMFIERISDSPRHIFPTDQVAFTDRETEVLKMLVEGRSNKEIGTPLGIRERTVKAHVAKLMRKVGVENRVALTVHAITHSLVPPQ